MQDESTPRQKRNQLGFAAQYKVTEYLKSVREKILAERPTWAKLSAWVREETGIRTTNANLFALCKVIGLEWGRPKARSAAVKNLLPGGAGRIRELEAGLAHLRGLVQIIETKILSDLDTLEAEVAQLRGLVHHLYRELGAKPPTGYYLPMPTNGELPLAEFVEELKGGRP